MDSVSSTPQPTSTAGDSADTGVTVRCAGVRGSIPSPGPYTVRYGGNTSCVELCSGSTRLLLDAGSGIRALGRELASGDVKEHTILLTHFHWDHIQGFPFFGPLHDPACHLRVFAPGQPKADVRQLFERQMDPAFFPVPLEAAAARLTFHEASEGPVEGLGAVVHAMRVRHPSHVLGYRIELEGRVVCYVPDNELASTGYDLGPRWREEMIEFVGDADLLIHDAMYTESEYENREGWGHSTFRQAVRLAEDAGVRRLLFFHHDPARTDEQLDRIVHTLREHVAARGSRVELEAASEASSFHVEPRA
ncbi:MAG: MBL fold metallo-hydrolase [Gemmatimonadota bacterium]|nr:MBL fold metallo-hydrolase [Gemmatimonadota bacterium]